MRAQIMSAAALATIFICFGAAPAVAQTRDKPTEKEILAIRDCVKARRGTEDDGEGCMFRLVATPCTETAEGRSNQGAADCYRREHAIWDDMLNENYGLLQEGLDREQKAKLRDMQRAWIVSRDRTCEFYRDKIQGSMAVPLQAACLLRETAQRTLLLKVFEEL